MEKLRFTLVLVTFLLCLVLLVFIVISFFVKKYFIPLTSSQNSSITCGRSSVRIVNGQSANQSAWPWMVSFGVKHLHQCGGTLISSEYILTAAHCLWRIETMESIEVRLGVTNLSDITVENLYRIEKILLHHQFNAETFENDIALIRLDRSSRLETLCLPSISSFDYPPIDSRLVAIGWGHTSDPSIDPTSTISTHLQQTILPVLPIEFNEINRTSMCYEQEIDDPRLQFCAGYADGQSDTCQADSGSPLMFFNNDHWELVGIVSYGSGCAQKFFPGIYTRVSAYLDWINDRINA